MNTQTVISTPHALPPPAVVLNSALPTGTSSVMPTTDSGDIAPGTLTLRATQVTLVLREILEDKGYPHGGIND
jgi:hypothetical protein